MHFKVQWVNRDEITVKLLGIEGVKTAEIEGEFLNRSSVQSSIRRKLGLSNMRQNIKPAESGMADLMVDVYKNYKVHLSKGELNGWHKKLMTGRNDLDVIGGYREHEDKMQIVSGALGLEKVHFEAPASKDVEKEMERFVQWFNESLGKLPTLTRAGIAHLYFVCIHPYEDGNGRIVRALVEKSLSQSVGYAVLSGLSREIAGKKRDYYDALTENNQDLEITDWLIYLGETLIDAQEKTILIVERVIEKANMYAEFGKEMNERQKKVLDRLYDAEPEGFEGGLSASNYISITKTSRVTASRDLAALVRIGVLKKSGKGRFTRYYLG